MALKTSTNFSGVTPRLVNARPPGCAKLAKAPSLELTGQANTLQFTWLGGGEKRGRDAGKGLTHTFHLKKPISHSSLCNSRDIVFSREIYRGIHLSGSESIYNCCPHRTASLFCVEVLSQLEVICLLVVSRPHCVETL